jgi:two-component system phosphate regulon sensor histidine kinase PhoR
LRGLKIAFLIASLLIVGADLLLLENARGFRDALAWQRLLDLARAEGRRSWRDYEPYSVPTDAVAAQVVLVRSPLADPEPGAITARFFWKDGRVGSPWFTDGLRQLDPDDPAAGEKRRRFEALRIAGAPYLEPAAAVAEIIPREIATCEPALLQAQIAEGQKGNAVIQQKLNDDWQNVQSVQRASKNRTYSSASPVQQMAAPAAAPTYDVRVTDFMPSGDQDGRVRCWRRVDFTTDGRIPPLGPYYQGFEVELAALAGGSSLSLTPKLLYGAAALIFLLGTAGLVVLYRGVAARLELARRQTDFTAAVSHELKAPLAGIRALAEMLHEGMVTAPEKQHEYVGNILHESERLSRLVTNVLDTARLERKERTYVVAPADPAPAVREAVEIFHRHLVGRGFTVEVAVPETLPEVPIDRDALVQAIANLVDNAAKYTAPCPERRISVRAAVRAGGEVAVEVKDSGIGIDAGERAHLFTPFRRGRDPLARGTGGAGLGLPIAKAHVAAMGGAIEVESEKGKGSTFRIVLGLHDRPI